MLRDIKCSTGFHPYLQVVIACFKQGKSPLFRSKGSLRVYRNEVKILLWVTVIQLVMSMSSILLNNFAQTAFMKRYGVEALPTVFLIEAVLTFFLANAVGLLMNRYRTIRVFTGLFLFFEISVGLIRGLLLFGNLLVYPTGNCSKAAGFE